MNMSNICNTVCNTSSVLIRSFSFFLQSFTCQYWVLLRGNTTRNQFPSGNQTVTAGNQPLILGTNHSGHVHW
jgi:hypothetical protein